MEFFPIYLNLKNKKILIIGAGSVAFRKINKIIEFSRDITVISQEFSLEFVEFAQKYRMNLIQRAYRDNDINGFDIVFVATNTEEIHKRVFIESRNRAILMNSSIYKEYCDFIFPSYIKKGDLTITISTNGISPALSKELRCYIQNLIPDSINLFIDELKKIRDSMPKGRDRMEFLRLKVKDYVLKWDK